MKSILRINEDVIELNALFLQPTRFCARNCDGCYVIAHKDQAFHTSAWEQCRLFRKFYFNEDNCSTNQITISIDDMPKEEGYQRLHMKEIFIEIIACIRDYPRPINRPEVHMTFHTHHTIKQYLEILPSIYSNQIRILDMISISEISLSQGNFYQSLMGGNAKLNWNYLIPEIDSSFDWNKEVKKFQFAHQHFDHIYLVIKKSPVGRHRDLLTKIGDKNRMNNDILYIKTILGKLSPEIQRKINIDGCLLDTQRYFKTSFGCSSNISKFQVWPDGTVTGCPYAFNSNGDQAKTAENILANIRNERKRYDFKDRCHLPKVYSSLG